MSPAPSHRPPPAQLIPIGIPGSPSALVTAAPAQSATRLLPRAAMTGRTYRNPVRALSSGHPASPKATSPLRTTGLESP